MDLTLVLTNIGGILSLIGTAALAFKPCLHASLFKSISHQVQKKKKVEAMNLIYDRLIQERFSYEGLNDLYDRVDEFEHSLYIEVKSQIHQEAEERKSLMHSFGTPVTPTNFVGLQKSTTEVRPNNDAKIAALEAGFEQMKKDIKSLKAEVRRAV